MSVALTPSPFFTWFNAQGQPAVGYQLFTYIAGTSTPQATYVDSTGLIQNANPVVLNSAGYASVWTVQGQTYKFVLEDANGNPVWSQDQISGGLVLTQTSIGLLLYPITAAETAASVIPTAYFYPPLTNYRYGATGTGSTDDTQAAKSLVLVAGQAPSNPQLGVGTFLWSSTVLMNGTSVRLSGNGWATQVLTNQAAGDVLQVQGNQCECYDFYMNSSAVRTSGYFINLGQAGNEFDNLRIERVNMKNFFSGILYGGEGGTTLRILDADMTAGVSGGIGITIQTTLNSADLLIQDMFLHGAATGSQMATAVQVTNAGDITLNNVSTVYGGTGLNVSPGTGQLVQALYLTDDFFDSNSGSAVNFNMTGTGSVQLVKAVNVWACSSANGVVLSASNAGTLRRSEWVNLIAAANTNDGFSINDVGVTDTSLIGCAIAQNANGLVIVSTATRFKVLGCVIGGTGQFANNTVGLTLAGLNDHFNICDNDFSNNTTPANIVAPVGGVAGQSWFIRGNQGIVTQAVGQVTLTAAGTTTAVTHGLAATPAGQGIKLTPLTSWGTAASWWVSAETSSTFTVSTNANPGAGVIFGWEARIWGA